MLATITKQRVIDELALDISSGSRKLRSEAAVVDDFDDAAAGMKRVDLPIRISDYYDAETEQSLEDVLMDRESVCTLITGGNQSGKTAFGTHAWMPLRWLWLGGPESRFRLMGYDYERHVWTLARKMFIGEGGDEHSIPSELIVDGPTSSSSKNRFFRLIDGSFAELIVARDGDRLKSVKVAATQWTETTATKDVEAFPVAVARHITTRGQLLCDSTPKRGHFIEQAAKGEVEIKGLPKTARRPFNRAMMFSSSNPWSDPDEVAVARATAAAIDPVKARQEFDGAWISGNPTIYADVWKPADMILDMPKEAKPDLERWGLIDCTTKAVRQSKIWRGKSAKRHNWVIGVDVNYNPHTALPMKIVARKGTDPDDPANWGVLVYDEIRSWACDAYQAADNLHKAQGGIYRDGAISIDAAAHHQNQHFRHTGGRGTTPILDYERWGFTVAPPLGVKKGKAQAPGIELSISAAKHVMRARPFYVNGTLCKGTIKAFETQEDDGTGKPVKVSNAYSDREQASYMDSFRYGIVAVFADIMYARQTPQIVWR